MHLFRGLFILKYLHEHVTTKKYNNSQINVPIRDTLTNTNTIVIGLNFFACFRHALPRLLQERHGSSRPPTVG